ncbi:MAG TPA: aminotransferase class III-fold pyridoxal phosphate-dependent enzyme [Streptosporangiaceae bacterium]|jgi:adenosylmethionine-8-amino-7-oxononanoate aminotransferase
MAESRLWHPFADMSAVRANGEFVIERAEDVWVWDSDGRRYLDATASLWYSNVGHGRAEIVDAAAAQMRRLDAYSVFNDYANPPARDLAARLAALAPMDDARIFLTSGGGDSVDTAIKLARLYWNAKGETDRVHVISRSRSYHGTHGIGTGIAGIETNRVGFGEVLREASRVDYDSPEALRAEIERLGPSRVAAFIFEPVIGAGGVYAPPEGYVTGVAEVCREYGVLLISDEVICGFGRLGRWFGVQRWGVSPDMITFAKGVTSGYVPLGGVVVSDRVAAPFWDEPGRTVRHGATYSGHPVACAAALANLDLLEKDGLYKQGEKLEGTLAETLSPLAADPRIGEIRAGTGLLAGVDLAPDVLAADPGAVVKFQMAVRAQGVLVRPLGTGVAISPPLTITPEHLAIVRDALAAALDAL